MVSGYEDIHSTQIVYDNLYDGGQFVNCIVASLEHFRFGSCFITESINCVVVDVDDFLAHYQVAPLLLFHLEQLFIGHSHAVRVGGIQYRATLSRADGRTSVY